jgi:hypothetical protein
MTYIPLSAKESCVSLHATHGSFSRKECRWCGMEGLAEANDLSPATRIIFAAHAASVGCPRGREAVYSLPLRAGRT